MPLTVAGKIDILNTFISEEYYLGLFTNSSSEIPTFSPVTSLQNISVLEVDKLEYERILIESSDWTLDEDSLSIYVTTPISISPKLQDWTNIQGYFLTHTLDNSGYLIYINVYDVKKNLTRNLDTLQIQLRIFFN